MNNPLSLISKIILAIFVAGLVGSLSSCDDSKSYAEQLTDENHAVNRFLADNRVIDHIPADSVLEYGPDAPYYCLDEENSVYLQVIDPGDTTRAEAGQMIYFRYRRYALTMYYGTISPGDWSGNADDMLQSPSYFKYDDPTDYQSQTWGTGLQQPLKFVGFNSEVNIVIKSTVGPPTELANVVPFLWNVRYFRSQI